MREIKPKKKTRFQTIAKKNPSKNAAKLLDLHFEFKPFVNIFNFAARLFQNKKAVPF